MKPTRTRTLLLIGAVAAAVTWAVLTAIYSSLPPLTWTLVPALLIAAAAAVMMVAVVGVLGLFGLGFRLGLGR